MRWDEENTGKDDKRTAWPLIHAQMEVSTNFENDAAKTNVLLRTIGIYLDWDKQVKSAFSYFRILRRGFPTAWKKYIPVTAILEQITGGRVSWLEVKLKEPSISGITTNFAIIIRRSDDNEIDDNYLYYDWSFFGHQIHLKQRCTFKRYT